MFTHNTILSGVPWVNSWIYCKIGYWAPPKKDRIYWRWVFILFISMCPFLSLAQLPEILTRCQWGYWETENKNHQFIGCFRFAELLPWQCDQLKSSLLNLQSQPFEWPHTFRMANALGSRISSNNSATGFPFLIDFHLQSIPKSWTTSNMYWLPV